MKENAIIDVNCYKYHYISLNITKCQLGMTFCNKLDRTYWQIKFITFSLNGKKRKTFFDIYLLGFVQHEKLSLEENIYYDFFISNILLS